MIGLKKNIKVDQSIKRQLIESDHKSISVTRQCELLGISRSSYYYHPIEETSENLELMRLLDEQYLHTPFYGVLRMKEYLNGLGYHVNEKRVRRLLRKMGLMALYPKPKLTKHNKLHEVYPYLLRNVEVIKPNQVWSTDITYIPMKQGFLYLVAIIDWYSRYVLSWGISNSLDVSFCIDALKEALQKDKPEIFNTDQGCQFTSKQFTSILKKESIKISMDGKGRAIDNIFIERLWRNVKYENIYLNEYITGADLFNGLKDYFKFYNYTRKHQSLAYKAPSLVYYGQNN